MVACVYTHALLQHVFADILTIVMKCTMYFIHLFCSFNGLSGGKTLSAE